MDQVSKRRALSIESQGMESFQHYLRVSALLRRFHRAQVPGIVIAMTRFIGHDPEEGEAS